MMRKTHGLRGKKLFVITKNTFFFFVFNRTYCIVYDDRNIESVNNLLAEIFYDKMPSIQFQRTLIRLHHAKLLHSTAFHPLALVSYGNFQLFLYSFARALHIHFLISNSPNLSSIHLHLVTFTVQNIAAARQKKTPPLMGNAYTLALILSLN